MKKQFNRIFVALLLINYATGASGMDLHNAVMRKDTGEVRRLLYGGANVNKRLELDKPNYHRRIEWYDLCEGITPLSLAFSAPCVNHDIVKMLMKYGADAGMVYKPVDRFERHPDPGIELTPLQDAAFSGRAVLKLLLGLGADLESSNSEQYKTALQSTATIRIPRKSISLVIRRLTTATIRIPRKSISLAIRRLIEAGADLGARMPFALKQRLPEF